MNAEQDRRERRAAKIKLVVLPLPFIFILATVLAGIAPGLEAGHPTEYLVATCVLWMIIIEVLPILRLARIFSLPIWFECVLYGNMYFYVSALCGGLYLNVDWWGDMTHVLSSLIVAGFVFLVLCMASTRIPSYTNLGGRGGMSALLFLVAMSFGGIWEIMEGMTDFISGKPYMVYGASDTLGDVTADLLGVTLMTIIAFIMLGTRSPEQIASDVRFGRKAFETED